MSPRDVILPPAPEVDPRADALAALDAHLEPLALDLAAALEADDDPLVAVPDGLRLRLRRLALDAAVLLSEAHGALGVRDTEPGR